MGLGVFAYVWQQAGSANSSNYVTIVGATDSTYTIPNDESLNGRFLQVVVTYTDAVGTMETVISAAHKCYC